MLEETAKSVCQDKGKLHGETPSISLFLCSFPGGYNVIAACKDLSSNWQILAHWQFCNVEDYTCTSFSRQRMDRWIHCINKPVTLENLINMIFLNCSKVASRWKYSYIRGRVIFVCTAGLLTLFCGPYLTSCYWISYLALKHHNLTFYIFDSTLWKSYCDAVGFFSGCRAGIGSTSRVKRIESTQWFSETHLC